MYGQLLELYLIIINFKLTGVLGIISTSNFINSIINDYYKNQENVSYSMAIVVFLVVSEFLPIFISLDYTFMLTYIKRKKTYSEVDSLVRLIIKKFHF